MKTLGKKRAERIARTVLKTVSNTGKPVRLALKDTLGYKYSILVFKNTDKEYLVSELQDASEAINIRELEEQDLIEQKDGPYISSDDYYMVRYRQDILALALLRAVLQAPPLQGMNFEGLRRRTSKFDIDQKEFMFTLDFLIRSGMIVRTVTGGFWWVGNWRRFCMSNFALPYLSPFHFLTEEGKISCKKKVYGHYARKNFKPSKAYGYDL